MPLFLFRDKVENNSRRLACRVGLRVPAPSTGNVGTHLPCVLSNIVKVYSGNLPVELAQQIRFRQVIKQLRDGHDDILQRELAVDPVAYDFFEGVHPHLYYDYDYVIWWDIFYDMSTLETINFYRQYKWNPCCCFRSICPCSSIDLDTLI